MAVKYNTLQWHGKKTIVGETELHPGHAVNLIIGFHGAGSTPENMLIHGNKLKLENSLMVYPEAPIGAGKGLWSWWDDGPRQKEAVKQFIDYASQMVDRAHQHVKEKTDAPVRTCLWGFSQGGAASLVYTLRGPHRLRKVASVCGFLPELPEDKNPAKDPVEILGIYGANDEIVPAFLADYALEEMKNAGHALTVKETEQGHELNQENLRDLTGFFSS